MSEGRNGPDTGPVFAPEDRAPGASGAPAPGVGGRNAADPCGPTVVIGVGSPLMGDDGLGLAALEALRGGWVFDPAVELWDGGTWGMNLLPLVESAERLLFLDAVRRGGDPGAVVTVEREELPRFLSTKLSPHQIDLREVLALAELRGTLPSETVALGVEPARVALSSGLSAEVERALPALVAVAVERLRRWGHRAHPAGTHGPDEQTPGVAGGSGTGLARGGATVA